MSAVVPAAIPGGHPRQAVAPLAVQEAARMEAVRRYDVLDTPPDGAFDRVAAIAARLFDVPVATVTIVDSDRIWFKATHGLDGVSQIGRDPGLCASTILTDDTLVIPDTLADTVASANPLVAGPMKVRFYAAAPIITADGHRLGTVNMEVEQLFGRPGQAFQTTTAFGLAILAVFGLSFGAAVQSGYEKAWNLSPARWWARWRHVLWLAVFIGFLFLSATSTLWRRSQAGGVTAALSAVLFVWWSQRLLLGARVRWRALFPGVVSTVVGLLGLRLFSRLVYSPLIASNTVTYGPFGTVLVIQSWLVGVGVVVFGGALVGRLLNEELPRAAHALRRKR